MEVPVADANLSGQRRRGETPAEHLSRLRVQHPRWRVERSSTGTGFTAHAREERAAPNFLYSPDLPGLEGALIEAGGKGAEQ
jgi:hypothetical protein